LEPVWCTTATNILTLPEEGQIITFQLISLGKIYKLDICKCTISGKVCYINVNKLHVHYSVRILVVLMVVWWTEWTD